MSALEEYQNTTRYDIPEWGVLVPAEKADAAIDELEAEAEQLNLEVESLETWREVGRNAQAEVKRLRALNGNLRSELEDARRQP